MDTNARLSFQLPPGWLDRPRPDAGILAACRPRRAPRAGVPPEIVLRTTSVEGDLDRWRDEALGSLRNQLDGFDLEDGEEYDLGPHRTRYDRFGHRLGSAELISEQWSWLVDGLGVTLTCTVARQEYAAYCDLFEDVAATVEILSAAA